MMEGFSGLIGALIAACVIAIAARTQKPARKNAEGWKMLRPGWLVHATMLGLTGIAALAAYILVAGSSRPDADTQAFVAALLLLGWVGALIYYGWTGFGRTIMWKGNELRVRTCFGGDRVRRISDVSSVKKSEALGEYKLTFGDGSTLRLSAYFHGAEELVKRLPVRARD